MLSRECVDGPSHSRDSASQCITHYWASCIFLRFLGVFIFFYLIFAGTNDCVTLCCGQGHHMSHITMTSICGVSTPYGISSRWVSRAAAKLACQRSPVNGLRPKLHRSRQPIRRAITRKVTTMGLPIPIIGKSLLFHSVCSLTLRVTLHCMLTVSAGPLFNPVFAALAYALGAAR